MNTTISHAEVNIATHPDGTIIITINPYKNGNSDVETPPIINDPQPPFQVGTINYSKGGGKADALLTSNEAFIKPKNDRDRIALAAGLPNEMSAAKSLQEEDNILDSGNNPKNKDI